MKKMIVCYVMLLAFVGIYSCNDGSNTIQKLPLTDTFALINRGDYLVQIMGCDDCHSPKKMGPLGPEIIQELRLSGYQAKNTLPPIDKINLKYGWALFSPDLTAAVGAWGTSFSSNITSHETGIGTWNFEQFKTCLTQGKYKGLANSRTLLPPMPWANYGNMEQQDLQAIYLFLKNTKPVQNVVPPARPPHM